jgi:hypothetical protein
MIKSKLFPAGSQSRLHEAALLSISDLLIKEQSALAATSVLPSTSP